MVRIAYIVDSFAMGGLERCVARLVNGLDSDRFEPVVICLRNNGAAADWIEREGVQILEIGKGAGTDWAAISRLSGALKGAADRHCAFPQLGDFVRGSNCSPLGGRSPACACPKRHVFSCQPELAETYRSETRNAVVRQSS